MSDENATAHIESLIRDVADFPKPGILFKDITPLLASPDALDAAVELMTAPFRNSAVDVVVGMESRGFIFGPLVARLLRAGFAPARKPGKLPWKTRAITYDLEYGSDSLELHQDAAAPGDRVLIVDDLLATGGTAGATERLITGLGAEVVGMSFLIELDFLRARDRLAPTTVHSVVHV